MGSGHRIDRRRMLAGAAALAPALAGGTLSGRAAEMPAEHEGPVPQQGGRPREATPGAPKPADAKPAEAKPIDGKPADAKPADAKPADAKPVEARPDGRGRKAVWLNYEFLISWERVTVLQELVTGLVDKGFTDLTLLISSNGGDLAAAISCHNFLLSTGLKLTTCNVGNVYSAAVMLFLAGERRVADLATQFVIHPPSQATVVGSATLDDLRLRSEALDRDALRMRDLIVARSRMTAAQLDPMLGRTTFIGPQQAVGYGLATEIGHLVKPRDALLVTMPMAGTQATMPMLAR